MDFRRVAVKTLMVVIAVATFGIAVPAVAQEGPCQSCEQRWLWPWLEDCWFCEDTECGAILCHLEQWSSGDMCLTEGDGCGEGNPHCTDEDWQDLRFQTPRPEVKLAKACERSLSESWRLTAVRVSSSRGKRRA